MNHRYRGRTIAILSALALFAVALLVAVALRMRTPSISSFASARTLGARASSVPLQLYDGSTVGASALPAGDTAQGGRGQTVDGITCHYTEYLAFHIHAHLAIFVHGKQIAVPEHVGIVPNANPPCLYWLHTHDASGIIHVESPVYRGFVLGQFFAIWGRPLSHTRVGPFRGTVTVFVGGLPYRSDPKRIPLTAHQEITLEVGTPLVRPPVYVFPPNE